MGPDSRRGPAKLKNQRRREMSKGIEEALSEAMTPPDTRSMRQKLEDRVSDFAARKQDVMRDFRANGDIQKYKCGGTVKKGYAVGGDVRYDNKGKCY